MRLTVSILLLSFALYATPEALIWPLDCKPQLTSSFGEFRVGHFHAGLDFRTPAGEGMAVYAPRDGNIVRVRKSPWGYGKVIYYESAGDTIAVFAHLSAFTEALEARIEEYLFKNKSNTAELWFKKGDFAYKAGDTIAFSGATGAGSAHLHFEIRKGFDKNINPGTLGYITEDFLPPRISALWAVPWGNNSTVNGSFRPVKIEIPDKGEIAIRSSGQFYFAIESYDLESNENANRYGFHEAILREGQGIAFHYLADTFSYSQTRQIGLLYDLALQEEMGLKRPPFRLFHPFGADIGLLKGTFEGSGIVCSPSNFELSLSDFKGNTTTLKFKVEEDFQPRPIRLNCSVKGAEKVFSTDLAPEDTLGLRFEYNIGGKSYRGKMPTEAAHLKLKGDIKLATIRAKGGTNPIALWRGTSASSPQLSFELHGAEFVIVRAKFPTPPSSLPLLSVGMRTILPRVEDETTYAFRIFDLETQEQLRLSVASAETMFYSNLIEIKDGAKINLFDGVFELNIPKGGVFFPFNILPKTYRITPDSTLVYSIQPAGALLRSKARITFMNTHSGSLADKTCIVRIWQGELFFVGCERDEQDRLYTTINTLGDFAIALDTVAPKLVFKNKNDCVASKSLSAEMTDNLSGFTERAHPQSYIDGEWHPTEFDPDKNLITINISKIEPGEHIWRVVARDVVGNIAEKELRFNKEGK